MRFPHSAADVPCSALWLVDLVAAAPALHAFEARHQLLTVAERERATALRDGVVRAEWLAAHIALRLIIGSAAGHEVARAAFAVTERGKPLLAQSPYAFSLSHAPGVALIGLTMGRTIGVDIERHREVRLGDQRRASIEAAAELLSVDVLPHDPAARFLQAWVRIEALAKADGCGVGRMLTRLGVRGGDAGTRDGRAAAARKVAAAELARAALAPEEEATASLAVFDLALGEGLFASVASASASEAGRVSCHRLPERLDGLEKLFA